MTEENENKIKPIVSKLWKEAFKYRQIMISEEDLIGKNRNADLKQEIERQIRRGERLNISITGKTRKGKSTVGMYLGLYIHDILQKLGMRPKEDQFGTKNILRDWQELIPFISGYGKQSNLVIVIDEESMLQNSGANSTALQNFIQDYSNTFAALRHHTISITPKNIPDETSDLIIDILSKDTKNQLVGGNFYIRITMGGLDSIQLLGHVNFYVGKIIKNWLPIQELFLQQKIDEKSPEFQKLAKKDFYVKYMEKKHLKFKMLQNEGIFRPRMLQYVKIIKEVTEELMHMSKAGRTLTAKKIGFLIQIKLREHKIPTSMLGDLKIEEQILEILEAYKAYYQETSRLESMKQKGSNELDLQYQELAVKQCRSVCEQYKQDMDKQIELYDKYMEM